MSQRSQPSSTRRSALADQNRAPPPPSSSSSTPSLGNSALVNALKKISELEVKVSTLSAECSALKTANIKLSQEHELVVQSQSGVNGYLQQQISSLVDVFQKKFDGVADSVEALDEEVGGLVGTGDGAAESSSSKGKGKGKKAGGKRKPASLRDAATKARILYAISHLYGLDASTSTFPPRPTDISPADADWPTLTPSDPNAPSEPALRFSFVAGTGGFNKGTNKSDCDRVLQYLASHDAQIPLPPHLQGILPLHPPTVSEYTKQIQSWWQGQRDQATRTSTAEKKLGKAKEKVAELEEKERDLDEMEEDQQGDAFEADRELEDAKKKVERLEGQGSAHAAAAAVHSRKVALAKQVAERRSLVPRLAGPEFELYDTAHAQAEECRIDGEWELMVAGWRDPKVNNDIAEILSQTLPTTRSNTRNRRGVPRQGTFVSDSPSVFPTEPRLFLQPWIFSDDFKDDNETLIESLPPVDTPTSLNEAYEALLARDAEMEDDDNASLNEGHDGAGERRSKRRKVERDSLRVDSREAEDILMSGLGEVDVEALHASVEAGLSAGQAAVDHTTSALRVGTGRGGQGV